MRQWTLVAIFALAACAAAPEHGKVVLGPNDTHWQPCPYVVVQTDEHTFVIAQQLPTPGASPSPPPGLTMFATVIDGAGLDGDFSGFDVRNVQNTSEGGAVTLRVKYHLSDYSDALQNMLALNCFR